MRKKQRSLWNKELSLAIKNLVNLGLAVIKTDGQGKEFVELTKKGEREARKFEYLLREINTRKPN